MAANDYPIDLRIDYPERSSRGWAALTILLIKFLALIPHAIILVFLYIGQIVVAFVAQIVVAVNGEYPPGMHAFVGGVLRWSTRVSAFLFSLTDRYPPFTLQPDPAYPVEVVLERPTKPSRVYAAFTVLVQVLALAGLIAFVVWLARGGANGWFDNLSDNSGSSSTSSWYLRIPGQTSSGLILRQIAALPHYIVLAVLGLVSLVIFLIVQWIILFTAKYPRGMFDLVVGITRWQTRVTAYALGLIDRYPPFSFDPSTASPAPAAGWQPATSSTWATPSSTYGPAAGGPAYSGQAPGGQAPGSQPPMAPQPIAPQQTAPPEWYPDPLGRHQYRYWDGAQWTPHVADNGQTGWDPVG